MAVLKITRYRTVAEVNCRDILAASSSNH